METIQPWTMTPSGVIQYVMILLLMLMVWLIKSLIKNDVSMRKDSKEQADKDRQVMKEECHQVRVDHREDMKNLLADSEANRKTFEEGFDKIAEAIASRGRRAT